MFIDLPLLESELTKSFADLKISLFEELNSTNTFLKQCEVLSPSLCYCQKQVSGYGQQQSVWSSGSNDLTFSVLLPLKVPVTKLAGLSQLIGVVIAKNLNKYFASDAALKWPNDLVRVFETENEVRLAKLGGVLIEVKKHSANETWVVIGIGLNAGSVSYYDEIQQVKRDGLPALLKSGCGFADFDQQQRIIFFKSLIADLLQLSVAFNEQLFAQGLLDFEKLDYFTVGQNVIVYDTATVKKGTYQGVNASGELLVSIDSLLSTYHSGSVSIRPDKNYE